MGSMKEMDIFADAFRLYLKDNYLMTPDRAIDAAQEALAREDREYASELYEVAARARADADQEQAAQLYKLASMYAELDYARQDRLADEAQRLLQLVGGQEGHVADVLLVRPRPQNKRAT